jgi:DNA-binding winged helix-turn-helix (wHTH) protein
VSGEVRKAGVKLKLGGQPFQVLAILLERPGDVFTREELQKRLWPDTFVDVDHNLNTAINKIREALGDSSENPRFVETLPRRGISIHRSYRSEWNRCRRSDALAGKSLNQCTHGYGAGGGRPRDLQAQRNFRATSATHAHSHHFR